MTKRRTVEHPDGPYCVRVDENGRAIPRGVHAIDCDMEDCTCGAQASPGELLRALESHGIDVRRLGDKVEALDCQTCRGELTAVWIDVSGWSLAEVARWLGY